MLGLVHKGTSLFDFLDKWRENPDDGMPVKRTATGVVSINKAGITYLFLFYKYL